MNVFTNMKLSLLPLRATALALAALVLTVGCAVEPSPRGSVGAERAAAVRPGLGTAFGEERRSTTRGSYFRRSSSTPAATDKLFYNDDAGLREVLARAGRVERTGTLVPVRGGLVSWGVRGSRAYLVDGERVVAGRQGARYEIVIRNETSLRLEVVVSVDGLDVLDGRAASFGKGGYILDPHATITLDGFRTGEQTVAAFRFSSVANSYSARRHGETRNVGVIGLAVFREAADPRWAQPPPVYGDDELDRRRRADPFPAR